MKRVLNVLREPTGVRRTIESGEATRKICGCRFR